MVCYFRCTITYYIGESSFYATSCVAPLDLLSTYVFLPPVDNYFAGTSFGFSLEFRTLQCSGLLLYVASSIYSDHVALEIINGSVSINLNLALQDASMFTTKYGICQLLLIQLKIVVQVSSVSES